MSTQNRAEQARADAGTGVAPGRSGGRFAPGHSGNAKGRPPARAAQEPPRRFDGWTSLLSGLGTTTHDKRESFYFTADVIGWDQAEQIYRGDDLAARIIETPANEMVREGYDLCIADEDADAEPDDPRDAFEKPRLTEERASSKIAVTDAKDRKDLAEAIEHEWEELGLLQALHEALCWERAYGGSAILIGANDGVANLHEPLVMSRVKSVDFLTALEARELSPVAWYGNPRAKKYGQPAIYQLNPCTPGFTIDGPQTGGVMIHETRLIVFPGIRVSRRAMLGQTGGWGDSVLTRVWRVLRDFNLSWGSAGILVADFAQPVYKMKGLNELLVEDSKDLFKQRMQGMELSRSIARAIMIDGDDEFERKQTPVSGLPELLDRFATRLAAAGDQPLSLLFGESPGGLNASGASGDQLRMFYDRVRSWQRRRVVPAIRRITTMLFQTMGAEPETWTIKPRPLWQPTEQEQVSTRKTQMEIDSGYIDRGVIASDEIRDSRFSGDTYSFETRLKKSPIDGYLATSAAQSGNASEPPDAAPTSVSAGAEEIQKTAMNGAQITSLIEVISSAIGAAPRIPRDSAKAILRLGFQVSEADAAALLGPEDWKAPEPPTPPPNPFGVPPGGAPPTSDKPAPPVDAKADAADRSKEALLRKLAPSNACAECGTVGALEVDHVHGREWDPAALSHKQRDEMYWQEHENGVPLRGLCRSCNARDGAANKQKSRGGQE